MSYSALAAQRTRESITDWEYKTYEYITLQTDDEETQAQRHYQNNRHDDKQFIESAFDIITLLTLFFNVLPPELHCIVYTYILGHSGSIFVLHPPTSIFRYDTHYPVRPYTFPLKNLPIHPLTSRLAYFLTTHFFATNTFYTCYRYSTLSFLRTPFPVPFPSVTETAVCIPLQHIRSLTIIITSPESAEDGDGQAEYEWKALFPSARNTKCAMWKDALVQDFRELGDAVVDSIRGEDSQGCDVSVYLADVWNLDQDAGVLRWIEAWVENVRARGGRVGLVSNEI